MVLTEFACCWLSTLHYAGTVAYLWPEFPPAGRTGVARYGVYHTNVCATIAR